MIAILRCAVVVALVAPFVSGLLSACGSASDSNTQHAEAGTSGASGSNAGSAVAGDASANGGSAASAAGSGGVAGIGASGAAASETGGAASGSAGRSGNGGTSNGGSAGNGGESSNAGSAGFYAWPGGNQVATVDPVNTYSSELSGVHDEPAQGAAPAVLWAVQNQPSKLYRLLWNGSAWVSDPSGGWASGKTLRFSDGQGAPDSEGITKGALGSTGLYVSSERDNSVSATSRLSVLLFDDVAGSTTLTATREWNLTSDLPKVGSNLGLEAITWVPDSYLVAKGFIDESKQAPYEPTNYANHGDGIFFVGIEQNGTLYGFALDHASGGFTRVATIESGNPGVMDLSFDREVGYLWAACDDTCQGRTNVLDVDTRVGSSARGKFYVRRGFERPSSMPNLNNEGFAVASENTCQAGFKPVFYAEDGSTMGYAIRRDSVPCGAFLGN